jgi:hypothetical protein
MQVLALCSHGSAAVRGVLADAAGVLARPALVLAAFGSSAATAASIAAGRQGGDAGKAVRSAELRLLQARACTNPFPHLITVRADSLCLMIPI